MFKFEPEELLLCVTAELMRRHMTIQQVTNMLQSAADPVNLPNAELSDLAISLLRPYIQKDESK